MSKRHIMRIDLTSEAKKKFLSLSDNNGMTQVAMMSRLVEWFARQDAEVQQAALRSDAKAASPEITKLILKKMAGAK